MSRRQPAASVCSSARSRVRHASLDLVIERRAGWVGGLSGSVHCKSGTRDTFFFLLAGFGPGTRAIVEFFGGNNGDIWRET